jgi:hypothetical protein
MISYEDKKTVTRPFGAPVKRGAKAKKLLGHPKPTKAKPKAGRTKPRG